MVLIRWFLYRVILEYSMQSVSDEIVGSENE